MRKMINWLLNLWRKRQQHTPTSCNMWLVEYDRFCKNETTVGMNCWRHR